MTCEEDRDDGTSARRILKPAKAQDLKLQRGDTERVSIDGAIYVARMRRKQRKDGTTRVNGPFWERWIGHGNGVRRQYIGKDLIGYLLERRLEQEYCEMMQGELPGMEKPPRERPAWLPPSVWGNLVAAVERYNEELRDRDVRREVAASLAPTVPTTKIRGVA